MSAFYGHGSEKEEANPFYPEETMWEGPTKTICSPYGSIFEHHMAGGQNTFEERLSNTGAVPGRTSMDESASRKMGEKRVGKAGKSGKN